MVGEASPSHDDGMTKRSSTTKVRTHPPQRSPAPRLDPYHIIDQAPTRQEIMRLRRTVAPVHVVLRDVDHDHAA